VPWTPEPDVLVEAQVESEPRRHQKENATEEEESTWKQLHEMWAMCPLLWRVSSRLIAAAAITACITKMQKSARLGLLEDSEGKGKPSNKRKKSEPKKKPKCPTKAAVKKCKDKIKDLKPKQKACKDLKGIKKKC